MSKKNEIIEGQLYFDMDLLPSKQVVQANKLVFAKQSLKLNSLKLVRAVIMQIEEKDNELKPYVVSIKKLAELLHVSPSNLYRDIDKITNDIMNNPVFIKKEDENENKVRWVKIPWITRCDYDSEIGVSIKLNDELKPYLLNLKDEYNKYAYDNLLKMKSVYSSRLYELINGKILTDTIPLSGVKVILTVQEIREACNCEDKYKQFSNFVARIIEPSVQEINALTMIELSYGYIKKGRSVVAIEFLVIMKYKNK